MSVAREEINKFTPLGIRFWDPVLDRQIRDSLTVSIYPENRPEQHVHAYRTIGDIYTFSHIPGLRDIEYDLTSIDAGSPAGARGYVVNIVDRARRYVDVGFRVDLPLPYNGVFLSNNASDSPETQSPKGLHLYSSPVRSAPGWMAVVRGELVDQDNGNAASWAVVKLTAQNGETHHGIADVEGKFMVLFSYPVFVEGFGGSPSAPGYQSLAERAWPLEMEIFYSPERRESLPGTDTPDYRTILNQRRAEIWETSPGSASPPVESLELSLEFRKQITVRTEQSSQLLIRPSASSP